jgi:hypothetical protein
VIAGNDWTRFRPRLVLAEAIEPLGMQDASHRFEPALLAAGYRFAFFDNLNRWYVTEEVAADLLPRFPVAPLPWDSVRHLGEYGPAQTDATHPDHALARQFPVESLARLPFLTAKELAAHGAAGADPAALARIASLFDGGYVID